MFQGQKKRRSRSAHNVRAAWALVAALPLTLALSGCAEQIQQLVPAGPSEKQSDTESSAAITATPSKKQGIPQGFEDYYTQEIAWTKCTPDQVVGEFMPTPSDMAAYECATLSAPMNWDDPKSPPIELGIARHLGKKMDATLPPLFFNLGGPGGDAVGSLSGFVENILTAQLAARYETVALDPRGVGTSTPIWCMTDRERDEDLARDLETEGLSTEELVDLYTKEIQEFGQQCLERNGEILGYVDSDSVARDFDMARAALGADQIDYMGFSYGTVIGALYADLFPTHVANFMLDGPVDLSLNSSEVSALQLEGMEKSLYHWIEECQATKSCPLTGDLESGKEQMIALFEQADQEPIPTSDPDRPLDGGLLRTAVIGSLYSTSMYPLLNEGVAQAKRGDGSALLFLADYYNDRGDDGVYTANSADAFAAVNMLDYEPTGTPEQWQEESDAFAEKYPVLGSDFGFGAAGMEAWPVESRALRRHVTAAGAGKILVIGTTNDPATPYVMAEALAEALEGGVLVTVDGWDHTAYNRDASRCLTRTVDAFMLGGVVPEEGLVCPSS